MAVGAVCKSELADSLDRLHLTDPSASHACQREELVWTILDTVYKRLHKGALPSGPHHSVCDGHGAVGASECHAL